MTAPAVSIPTGPHPTQLLADGATVYVANADGHDVVAIDMTALKVTRRYALAVRNDAPPGQTPAGMALSTSRATLFVTESGFNDVAVVDVASGRVRGRIPTAWYPPLYGHAWTTQGMNDYHERNAHTRDDAAAQLDARVPTSIWPYPIGGEDSISPADMDFDWFTNLGDLPKSPRINAAQVAAAGDGD
jgi:hypothetical protein